MNQENKALKEHCSELEAQVKWLMEQLKITNKKTYGAKSEQSEYIYEQLEVIGKEVKKTLKIKPAEVIIQEDVYYTYACKNCEKNGIETPIVKNTTGKASNQRQLCITRSSGSHNDTEICNVFATLQTRTRPKKTGY